MDVWLKGAGHAKDGAPGQWKTRQPLKIKLHTRLWTQKKFIIYCFLHEKLSHERVSLIFAKQKRIWILSAGEQFVDLSVSLAYNFLVSL